MTMHDAVRSVLTQYATFSGRARRSEYWWFHLFTILVSIATAFIDTVIDVNVGLPGGVGVVGLAASLTLLLPTLAVTARRLHDTGRTLLWVAFPVVTSVAFYVALAMAVISLYEPTGTGALETAPDLMTGLALAFGVTTLGLWIALLTFLVRDSDPGTNKYGPSPKAPAPTVGFAAA